MMNSQNDNLFIIQYLINNPVVAFNDFSNGRYV